MEAYRTSQNLKADFEFVVSTLNNPHPPPIRILGEISLQHPSLHLVLCIIIVDGSHTNMSGIISVLVDEEGRVINNSCQTRIWYSAEWQAPKHVQKRVSFKSQQTMKLQKWNHTRESNLRRVVHNVRAISTAPSNYDALYPAGFVKCQCLRAPSAQRCMPSLKY